MSFDYYNLFWLLLPVAAFSGWLIAHLDYKRKQRKNDFDLPSAYFKGLNFLLNEQPDKAIEVFVKMLDVNPETVETHLALGNLFRRRGEVERAIRIHQNIIARPNLQKKQRSQALLELGQDYLKAGLFDRAENLFLELAESRVYRSQALRQLLHIYQQEKEWDNAITFCRKLAGATGESMDAVIAHYYCELAEQAINNKDYDAARPYTKKALRVSANCVRASILLGKMESEIGNYKDAIKAWKRIEKQDIHYLGEVAKQIADCYHQLDDEAGLFDFFQDAYSRHQSVRIMLAMADVIREQDGPAAAEKFVIKEMRVRPSVPGLHYLIELSLSQPEKAENEDLILLRAIIGGLHGQYEGYRCVQCGFRGRILHWFCPGCSHWDTVKPVMEADR
ncbi:MAG TPA: lipopolysaccharide assembly protein LapB [Acidiferrobacteraceae bacterium]|nr:lipopolysaccharide assembly protein LapB [Acidiferrobacteraceae bacterium]HEX20183.1 lipopolysaccharide assembly protein LapB [Acidiferrobacteraceae bacterium]